MKKATVTNFALASVLLLGLSSCGSADRTRLQVNVEAVDRECPMDLGSVGVMEGAKYDKSANDAIFTYVLNEDDGITTVASISGVGELQKSFMESFLQSESGAEFLDLLVKADASLTFVYKGKLSGDSVCLTLTPDELSDIASRETAENNELQQLERIVAITNAQCPSPNGDGLVMSGARLEDNFIVFYYDVDSDSITIEQSDLPEFTNATREALREELTDAGGLSQLKLMKKCGIGIKYVYMPSAAASDTVSIVITPEEVASF